MNPAKRVSKNPSPNDHRAADLFAELLANREAWSKGEYGYDRFAKMQKATWDRIELEPVPVKEHVWMLITAENKARAANKAERLSWHKNPVPDDERFSQKELRLGIAEETKEHGAGLAPRVVADHLALDPHYYTREKGKGGKVSVREKVTVERKVSVNPSHAEERFVEYAELKGFTRDEALVILRVYRKRKIVKFDNVGHFHVTHGAFLDEAPMKRALKEGRAGKNPDVRLPSHTRKSRHKVGSRVYTLVPDADKFNDRYTVVAPSGSTLGVLEYSGPGMGGGVGWAFTPVGKRPGSGTSFFGVPDLNRALARVGGGVEGNPERMYHVVAINERTGRKDYLTMTPVTHHEGVTIVRKQSGPHKDVRIQLEDASAAKNPSRITGARHMTRKQAERGFKGSTRREWDKYLDKLRSDGRIWQNERDAWVMPKGKAGKNPRSCALRDGHADVSRRT